MPSTPNLALAEADAAATTIQEAWRRAPARNGGSHSLLVGDLVRIRATVDEPAFGWGSVTRESIGPIQSIDAETGRVFVDFDDLGWSCVLSDL